VVKVVTKDYAMTNLGHPRQRKFGVKKDDEFYLSYGQLYWEDKALDDAKVQRTKKLNWRKQ